MDLAGEARCPCVVLHDLEMADTEICNHIPISSSFSFTAPVLQLVDLRIILGNKIDLNACFVLSLLILRYKMHLPDRLILLAF